MNAVLIGSIIRVRFKYDLQKILRIKLIPESKWDKATKSWLVPASPWHAWKLYEKFPDIEADKFVKYLAQCMPYFRALSERKDHPSPQFGLYPYQQAAVEYIEACNGRALIADSMGLGKSAVACAYARRNKLKSILVVCPATIKHKWVEEIKKWYNPNCQPIIVDESITPRADIIIMSYERMRMNRKDLEERKYDLMILDEVQAIKNHKALRTRAAKAIAAQSTNIVGLSATPMMNKPIDLWSELHILRPWEYSNYWNFGNAYCAQNYSSKYFGQQADFKGSSREEELRDRLSTIMIRRKKDDVLKQLPNLTRSVMWTNLTDYGAGIYGGIEAEVKEALRALSPDHKGYFVSALDRITALRQGVGAAKADLAALFISDFLEGTEDNNKIVVSCYFMKTIEGISERLEEPHIIMTGKDNHHIRVDKVKKFRGNGKERVFIMSAVGGEGIDLFGLDGSSISDILMVDRNWLPTSEEQIEGRLHRIGQTFPVTSHYLLAQNTIDVYMSNIIERKRAVGEMVANQGEVIKELVERILNER